MMTKIPTNLKEKARLTVQRLTAKNCMLGMSESVTGGQIAAALTKIDGCSGVLFASQVIYSPLGKSIFCNIPLDQVMEVGTVSEEMVDYLVTCMHKKFIDALNENRKNFAGTSFPRFFISLAIVGVAAGSVEGKEKGHVILGLETRRIVKGNSFSGEKINSSRKTHRIQGNRDEIIYRATAISLDLVNKVDIG
ncbi:MAG: CinA family protein [Promethearchaeota archaeon]